MGFQRKIHADKFNTYNFNCNYERIFDLLSFANFTRCLADFFTVFWTTILLLMQYGLLKKLNNIKDIFKQIDASFPTMLSEIIETQCMIKGMLSALITKLSNGNPDKDQDLVVLTNKLKDRELLFVVARFTEERED